MKNIEKTSEELLKDFRRNVFKMHLYSKYPNLDIDKAFKLFDSTIEHFKNQNSNIEEQYKEQFQDTCNKLASELNLNILLSILDKYTYGN